MLEKNYIVTGASSGIGKNISIALAQKGHNIVLIGRSEERLNETHSCLEKANHSVVAFDVREIDKIEEQVKILVGKYGLIDGFIHCAGDGYSSKFRNMKYDPLHNAMCVHFYSFVEFARNLHTLKKKEQELNIIGISSLASTSYEKYYTAYSAAKAAMEACVRTLSSELAIRNTRICSVRPATVDTPRLEPNRELFGDLDAHYKKIGYQPLGLIPPEEVAKTVLYLLEGGMKYISGANIPINAGAPV